MIDNLIHQVVREPLIKLTVHSCGETSLLPKAASTFLFSVFDSLVVASVPRIFCTSISSGVCGSFWLTGTEGISGFPPKSSLLCFVHFYVCVLVTQLCLTLCDPANCSLPGFPLHGILQARILEWIAIPFSRGSSQPRDWTLVSCIAGRLFTMSTLLLYCKSFLCSPLPTPFTFPGGMCMLSQVQLFAAPCTVDGSPPDSSVCEIFQARILEWVVLSFSRGIFWPRDQTRVSCIPCIGRWILYHCTTWEAFISCISHKKFLFSSSSFLFFPFSSFTSFSFSSSPPPSSFFLSLETFVIYL